MGVGSHSLTKRSQFDLTGRVAIVTGSTQGIGLAIAETLGGLGARVVVSSEHAAATARTAEALQSQGIDCIGVPCDVTDDDAVNALPAAAQERFGGVDVLVCNAGITGKAGPFASIDMADYDRVMAVNLRSMVALSGATLPPMAARGGGSAILISSIAGLRGNGAINAYALAKAGVAQLARNLAVEWGPKGIRVNAVSPGLIRTPLSETMLQNEAFMSRRMQMTPLRRPGEVNEVAGGVAFLASDAGAFVSGHNLVIDGGTTITDGS